VNFDVYYQKSIKTNKINEEPTAMNTYLSLKKKTRLSTLLAKISHSSVNPILTPCSSECMDKVYRKQPLYPTKVGVRSAYTHHPLQTPLVEYTGYVVVVHQIASPARIIVCLFKVQHW